MVMNIGYRLLAAQYIRRQAKQLAGQLEGLRAAEDVEFVHRARVATRRLRAALRMFDGCFGRKRLRRWRKAIRCTTAQLGDTRDHDVQIEFLCGILSALDAKECFPGIARILVQLERGRERLQRKVVKAVNRLERSGVLPEIRQASKRLLQKAASAAEGVRTPAVFVETQRHILRQLDELLRHQDSLADPDDQKRHHAMRIAAKRLRYTLEIARPVYPGRLDEAVEATKKVQSFLGDIHDCDVWAEHLDAFALRQRRRITKIFGHTGRFTHLQPGIDYLRQNRREHRQAAFEQLVEYWTELGRRQFWDCLTSIVLSRGQLPVEPSEQRVAVDAAAASRPVPVSDEMPQPWLQIDETGRVRHAIRKPLLTAGS